MALTASEINLYKSKVIAEGSTNGGRRSTTKVSSGQLGAVFDTLLPDDYLNGYDKTAKLFIHVDSDDDLPYMAAAPILDSPTPGEDWAVFYMGTARDTQGDHTSPKMYGVAPLAADVSAGAATLSVTVEDSSVTGIFSDGDTIYITDKTAATATSGSREKRTVSGAPSVSGTTVTITLSETLSNSYTVAAGARVCSAPSAADIACSVDNFVVTGTGTYDNTTYPVVTDNLGTIEQTWTIEQLTETTFSCVGDGVGSLANGEYSSDYVPINPDTGKPYFTMKAAGHGGTHATSDTIVFQTHGAEIALYLRLVGAAGSTVTAANKITLAVIGAV